jgi:hypothetical protein
LDDSTATVEREADAALRAAKEVAALHGVAGDAAYVVPAGSNVLVHLRPAPVVARVRRRPRTPARSTRHSSAARCATCTRRSPASPVRLSR